MSNRINNETIENWKKLATEYLSARNYSRNDITTGTDAWLIFSHAINTRDNNVYADRTITDGHIQTALAKVFPNAIFKNIRKIY